MAAMAQATKNEITLKGSVATVTEFFSHALSSILYQRGIYAPESFEPRKAYGLTVMAVKNDKLTKYLQAVLKQFDSAPLFSAGCSWGAVLVRGFAVALAVGCCRGCSLASAPPAYVSAILSLSIAHSTPHHLCCPP